MSYRMGTMDSANGLARGTLNNTQQQHWDLQSARDELGYVLLDDVANAIDPATLKTSGVRRAAGRRAPLDR